VREAAPDAARNRRKLMSECSYWVNSRRPRRRPPPVGGIEGEKRRTLLGAKVNEGMQLFNEIGDGEGGEREGVGAQRSSRGTARSRYPPITPDLHLIYT
jgi:hypothetical protein